MPKCQIDLKKERVMLVFMDEKLHERFRESNSTTTTDRNKPFVATAYPIDIREMFSILKYKGRK